MLKLAFRLLFLFEPISVDYDAHNDYKTRSFPLVRGLALACGPESWTPLAGLNQLCLQVALLAGFLAWFGAGRSPSSDITEVATGSRVSKQAAQL